MRKKTLFIILIISFCTLSVEGFSQVWTCPMHPQVKQSSPGKCPLCGMSLRQASNNSSSSASSSSRLLKTRPPIIRERSTAIKKLSTKNDLSAASKSVQYSKTPQAKTLSSEDIYSKEFPFVIELLGKVVKAIESGDKQTEITELIKVLDKLITIQKALNSQLKPHFANTLRCPIMGSPVNPDEVTNNLIREYKDRKVAFCCAECPPVWDMLNDLQKQEKIIKY